jgi:MFS family permease
MPSSPASLGEFRLLWISGLLASLGAQMSGLALPLVVLRETHSAVEAGAIGTVSMGILVLAMLPGGTLADLVERRRLMRVCDVFSLLATSALSYAVLTGRAPLALVLLVVAAGALITSLYGPAALGLLRAVVPREELGKASSRLQARSATARLIGPVAGGVLFSWHPAAPFLAEATCLLASTICLALMRARSAPKRSSGRALSVRSLGAGVTFIWRQPYLRTVLLVFGIGMNTAFSAMMFIAVVVASGGGRTGWPGGLVGSLAAAGSLTGALLAPRLNLDRRTRDLVVVTCWACAAAMSILIVARPPLLIGVLVGACMVPASLASIGFLTSLLLATPEAKVGRVQSAAAMVSSLFQPAGPLAAGTVLETLGARTAFVAISGVFALCGAIVTLSPAVRRGPAAPTTEPGSRPDLSAQATAMPDVVAHAEQDEAGTDAVPPASSPPAGTGQ